MFYESDILVRIFAFAKMKFVIHEVDVNIRRSEIFSFKYYWNTYGGILVC